MQQRQCVILRGNASWCKYSSEQLLADFDQTQIIWLSNNTPENVINITQQKSQTQLGKEFGAVIFDGLGSLNPDSLGVMIGTIKAGGVLILWQSQDVQTSLWSQYFKQIAVQFEQAYDSFSVIQQGQALPKLSLTVKSIVSDPIYLTEDQQQAVTAILRVVHGHRRRPLVLSADRGRGKSAALGIAAAQLIMAGRKRIVVTAPSLAIVDPVFEHASRSLLAAKITPGLIAIDDAEIRFIAPDVVIELVPKADVILVDEAAAIPASMLAQLLEHYSRIVFVTTLHGYEGTGRGFAIRFQKILTQKTPNWNSYRMETPIRWAKDDMLEKFSFESLLLNANPVDDQFIAHAQIDLCEFERLERQQLVDDESSLRELFGLMVLAHYRTRPSDLQMMLDRDELTIYVLRYQDHIVASAWLVKEGELEDVLAAAIYAGQRRLKGHLLPQSLLAHSGIPTAGALGYQRIIRLAVHPAVRQRGLGSKFLEQIVRQVSTANTDLVGASFGINLDLLPFWVKSGFLPARLGIYQDDISGSYAVMMLRSTSTSGQKILNEILLRFSQQWFYLLQTSFKSIAPEIIIAISQLLLSLEEQLSELDKREVEAFALAQRGYDFSQVALRHWLRSQINQPRFLQLSQQQQHLCVMTLLQQREWMEIRKRLSYAGKSQVISAVREAIKLLLLKQ